MITRDFNGDGLSDLLFRNPSTGVTTIWDAAAASTVHGAGSVGAAHQLFG